MALDHASTTLLGQLAQMGVKPLHESTPTEARAFGKNLPTATGPDMARVDNDTVEVPNGRFAVRTLVPQGELKGIIVYYHGGGWVVGELDGFDGLGRHLAQGTSCAVVLVDYRMAPEYRFPTAADDAYAALEWVTANSIRLVGNELPLIVAGDSAGGNLSAVVAQRARDRQGPEIALQVLVYPVTDADLNTGSYTHPESQLLLSRASMVWFWDHYVPNPADRAHPDASPLRAASLAGLPPAVLITANHDPLRDEGEAYAAALIKAGVPVTFKRFDDQMHGFFTMVGVLPGSAQGVAFVTRAIRQRLAELAPARAMAS